MKLFLGKKKFLVFPKISLLYLCLFILLFLALALILEFVILKPLKNEGVLSYSQEWEQEDKLIAINNHFKKGFKIKTDKNSYCIWRTDADNYSPDRITTINLCASTHGYSLYNNNFVNDFIWRDKVYNVSKNKITSKRILVVGDSYIWGDGYANMNDIWWRRLQRELVKRGYYDVEVIAIGWDGDSTRDELSHLKLVLKKYNPDIVVWGYVENDPDEYMIKTEYIDPNNPALFFKTEIKNENVKKPDIILKSLSYLNHVCPDLSSQLFKVRLANLTREIAKSENPEVVYDYGEWQTALLRGRNFEKYKKTVKDVSAFIQENKDTPIFFITLPRVPSPKYYNPRYKKIITLFESNHIKIYNLCSDLIKELKVEEWDNNWKINPANGHPGLIITDFYAREVANILEKDYPKYLPKKYSGHKPKELFINDWVPMTVNIKQNKNELSFNYPTNLDNFLSMPYGYKYIQLNLSYPIKAEKIIIEGKNLLSARLDLTYENPKDFKVYQLGQKKGKNIVWDKFKEKELINTIRINADFASKGSRNISLKVIAEGKN